MSGRTFLSLVAALFAFVCSAGVAAADTYSCPTSESITVGSVVQGGYQDLCDEDGVYEILQEGLDNGISKLRVVWTIPNVPPGKQYLNFWGTRPANSEGDNFQFYYNNDGKIFGMLIPGAIINHTFAPVGGATIDLNLTTTTTTYSTSGYALASDPIKPHGAWSWLSLFVDRVRIRISSSDRSLPLFAGIAAAGDVERYLGDVSYTTVGAGGGHDVTDHPGTGVPAAPATALRWAAKTQGTGTLSLTWEGSPATGWWW